MSIATRVFSNRDTGLQQEKDQRAQLQGKIQAQMLAGSLVDSPHHQTHQAPEKKSVSDTGQGKTLRYKCGQIRHWSKECPNKGSPLGPCPVHKKKGPWKRDRPPLQRERKTGTHFPTQEQAPENLA